MGGYGVVHQIARMEGMVRLEGEIFRNAEGQPRMEEVKCLLGLQIRGEEW